jgi:hypothetical protein
MSSLLYTDTYPDLPPHDIFTFRAAEHAAHGAAMSILPQLARNLPRHLRAYAPGIVFTGLVSATGRLLATGFPIQQGEYVARRMTLVMQGELEHWRDHRVH